MKRTVIIVLLILIALLLLYAAHLDGIVHIKAFAADECETCKLIKETDLRAEVSTFPANCAEVARSIRFDLALHETLMHGHGRGSSHLFEFGIPYNYCPECGRKIDQQDIYVQISDPSPVPKPTDYVGKVNGK